MGVYFLFLRQKNIRTKGSLNVQMSVQASLTYLCSFNVYTFGVESMTLLLYKNRGAKRVLQVKREAELQLGKTQKHCFAS